MKILLDTHVFIWWDSAPLKIIPEVLELCQSQDNALLLSVASVWEMQIKLQLGKLKLNIPLPELIESQQHINDIQILPIEINHVLGLGDLPSHHKDPFDRLIISQAKVEDIVLISKDAIFERYPIKVIWKGPK